MRFYFFITGLAMVIVPLSVTGSQSLMALSIVTGVGLQLHKQIKRLLKSHSSADHDRLAPGFHSRTGTLIGKWPLYSGWILFAWLLLIYGIRSLQYLISGNPLFHPAPYHNELTDFFLFLFAFLAAVPLLAGSALRQEKNSQSTFRWLYLVLTVFAVLVVLSGLGAVFSEVRLSKLFTGHGSEFSASNRPQFVFRTVGELVLYRPIGFMNTRLSYAGILIFALAVLLHRFHESALTLRSPQSAGEESMEIKEKHNSGNRASLRKWALLLTWAGLWFTGVILLLMNGSRSGQIGALISQLCILAFFSRNLWSPLLPKKKSLWATLAAVLVLVMGSGLYIYLLDSGTHRHTDFMRPLIWKGSYSLFAEHPLLGVGPGNFTDWFHRWVSEFYLEHPRTMYFLEITPDSHAHNDLLHLLTLGGLPAGILFLTLILYSVQSLFDTMSRGWHRTARSRTKENKIEGFEDYRFIDLEMALRSTLPGFFVAGLSQCYFQDDEVVVVFWVFLLSALVLKALRSKPRHQG